MSGPGRPLRVVALGGGHGLGATLRALRRCAAVTPGGIEITAVVTVADNGGSSGRLRRELAMLPPGDLRMAMAALLDRPGPRSADGRPGTGAPTGQPAGGDGWEPLLQHRFTSTGPLDGHALGNLMLAAAWDRTADAVAGLDLLGQLLGVPGRVLPMCAVPLDIAAEVETGSAQQPAVQVRGQAQVAVATGRIRRVWLEPGDPPACAAAVAAIAAADWVLLGPGSWFTSVLPHLLVPRLRDAVTDGPARVLLALNLDPATGETAAYPAAEHLQVLRDHAPRLSPHVVLADAGTAGAPGSAEWTALSRAVAAADSRLVTADLAERDQTSGGRAARHDPDRLAAALRGVLIDPSGPAAAGIESGQGFPTTVGVAGFRACQ